MIEGEYDDGSILFATHYFNIVNMRDIRYSNSIYLLLYFNLVASIKQSLFNIILIPYFFRVFPYTIPPNSMNCISYFSYFPCYNKSSVFFLYIILFYFLYRSSVVFLLFNMRLLKVDKIYGTVVFINRHIHTFWEGWVVMAAFY